MADLHQNKANIVVINIAVPTKMLLTTYFVQNTYPVDGEHIPIEQNENFVDDFHNVYQRAR